MNPFRPSGWIAVVAFLATAASADVVHLKDGGQIDGVVKRADDGWNVRTADGKVTHVTSDRLESIELTGNANTGPAAAMDRLRSLRRSVENINDLTEIIARFQRFADTVTDPSTSTEAKKDLAVWQDRASQNMVKVGSKWVLPAERAQLVDQAAASAERARQLLKQGRLKESDPILTEALTIDPQNAAALYLMGLLRYQQAQIPAARKAFETVAALVPNHAPTLNNLAITQWRAKQYILALGNYDAAMLASPVNKSILDNVASALISLPDALKQTPVAARALQHFQEQDQQLAEQLSQAGLHRYGASWASDNDMGQMHEQEKQTQHQLDQLAGDFDQARARVGQLDQNISDDQLQMKRIESTSTVSDPLTGIPIQVPLPQAYYDLGHDLQQMQRERSSLVGKLDGIKRQADSLKKTLPGQKFTGTQRPIGPEGTPLKRFPATAE